MKTLFYRIISAFNTFLEFFSVPQRRSCPHCGGGKCLGACQLIENKEN
jgi:hypothetical protein